MEIFLIKPGSLRIHKIHTSNAVDKKKRIVLLLFLTLQNTVISFSEKNAITSQGLLQVEF